MSRSFREDILDAERGHLEQLLRSAGDPARYRACMKELGSDLGRRLRRRFAAGSQVLLVCTAEDADSLAQGMIDQLEAGGVSPAVICFWNERKEVAGTRIAPILRRYEEPLPEPLAAVIIVKSIISGACVVKTNLLEVWERLAEPLPEVVIAAPVIHRDAPAKLTREVPFLSAPDLLWLACDSERDDDGSVRPGVGGSVYELYGFGSQAAKNRARPELVKRRNRVGV